MKAYRKESLSVIGESCSGSAVGIINAMVLSVGIWATVGSFLLLTR